VAEDEMTEQQGPDGERAPASEQAPVAPVQPVDLRDHVDFSTERAVRVRVFATERLALDVWCIEPRQSTPVLHEPDRDVAYTVIGGRSWFVTDQGEVGLDPMGAMLVPAGTVHGIDNRAADPLIVLAASSPPSGDPVDVPVADLAAAVHLPAAGPGPLRRLVESLLGTGSRTDADPPGQSRPRRDPPG
jgi:quercetin dioxygenase-like cupin family protein